MSAPAAGAKAAGAKAAIASLPLRQVVRIGVPSVEGRRSSGGIVTRSEGCESRIPSRLDMQLSL